MSITKISFSTLSITTVLELANQCGEALSSKHAEDPILGTPLANLEEPIQKAKLAVASSRKKELTEEINEADFRRDRAFVGFRKYVEAFQFKDWDRDSQKAAANLIGIIEKHGKSLYREGLTVQSALLASLFEELEMEQPKADLTTLGVEEWLNHLMQLQHNFSAMIQRRDELEAKKNIPTKADAKAELVKALSILLSGLDFLTNTQSTKYGEIGKLISEIIERIVASQR
ncbi:MAG: hypothetical protein ACJAYS_000074 [Lentimonas sp.]|jgi:hypothetical protein